MSDLLGSILQAMDKPPSIDSELRQKKKKQLEMLQKQQDDHKAKLRMFRKQVECRIAKFIQDAEEHRYKFKPMDHLHRSIVHDVAEIAGLTAYSFGEDEVDRYVMIFKKEFPPSEEELSAYRKGEEWNPNKAKPLARLKEVQETTQETSVKETAASVPTCNYKEKYERLLGKDVGKDGARIATPNKQFGFVPSDKKRDQRSIEQTLADIKAKKMRIHEENASSSAVEDSVGNKL